MLIVNHISSILYLRPLSPDQPVATRDILEKIKKDYLQIQKVNLKAEAIESGTERFVFTVSAPKLHLPTIQDSLRPFVGNGSKLTYRIVFENKGESFRVILTAKNPVLVHR